VTDLLGGEGNDHGSILALDALLQVAQPFVAKSVWIQASQYVLQALTSPHPSVRITAALATPKLAQLAPSTHLEAFISRCMKPLLQSCGSKEGIEAGVALEPIGKLALLLRERFVPHLDATITALSGVYSAQRSRRASVSGGSNNLARTLEGMAMGSWVGSSSSSSSSSSSVEKREPKLPVGLHECVASLMAACPDSMLEKVPRPLLPYMDT